jgi:hypothetical protein
MVRPLQGRIAGAQLRQQRHAGCGMALTTALAAPSPVILLANPCRGCAGLLAAPTICLRQGLVERAAELVALTAQAQEQVSPTASQPLQ